MAARRITLVITLAMLSTASGCPGAPSALLGAWTFTIGMTNTGVNLLPNGEATSFLIDATLMGELNWEVEGSRFILNLLTQEGNRFAYIGTITSDTAMNGGSVIWAGPGTGNSNTWSAVKQ